MSDVPKNSTRAFAPPLPPVFDPDVSHILNDPGNASEASRPRPLVQPSPNSASKPVAPLIPPVGPKNDDEEMQLSAANTQSEFQSEAGSNSTGTTDLNDDQKNGQKCSIANDRIDMTGGLMGWLTKAVTESKLLSDVAGKAKAGMETVLTTLDPGMKGFLSVDGVVYNFLFIDDSFDFR